jgi:hypothetical protein
MAKPLAISDYDAMRLTMLAAVRRSPLYDRMAVKWIVKVTTKRKLKLSELAWLIERFQEAKRGQGSRAERELVRFLGDGWDLPH